MSEQSTKEKIFARIKELESKKIKAREEDEAAEYSGSMFAGTGRESAIQNQIDELMKLL